MSIYVAYVGDVIIKPEFRADFGRFYRREFVYVEHELFKEFVREMMRMCRTRFGKLYDIPEWRHGDLLSSWKGHFETRYDKDSGGFTYGVNCYEGPPEFFTELLPAIAKSHFERESVIHDWGHDYGRYGRDSNNYFSDHAEVGQLIVKPEYREDFDCFYNAEFGKVKTELFKSFIDKYFDCPDYYALSSWGHDSEKESWRGKYKTSYDEETGRFVYGLSCKYYSEYDDFFDLLDEITETVISKDEWWEPM